MYQFHLFLRVLTVFFFVTKVKTYSTTKRNSVISSDVGFKFLRFGCFFLIRSLFLKSDLLRDNVTNWALFLG